MRGLMTKLGLRPASERGEKATGGAGAVGMLPSNQPLWGPVSRRVMRAMESPLEVAALTISSSGEAVRLRSGASAVLR